MSATELLVEPSQQSRAQRARSPARASLAIAIVLVVIVVTLKRHTFVFSHDGWRDTLLTPSILLLLAVGQMVVTSHRNVDLSVAFGAGTDGLRHRQDLHRQPRHPRRPGVRRGTRRRCAARCGQRPSSPSSGCRPVVTLGTMYVFRGYLTNEIGNGCIVAGDIPAGFEKLGTQQVLTISVLTIIAVVALIVVGYYLQTARGGRELYAIGSDPDAARLYGLNVGRRVFGAFVLSGALAGLAGVFSVARYATAFAGTGRDLELQAVAACVIGGVAIFGGSGTVGSRGIGAFRSSRSTGPADPRHQRLLAGRRRRRADPRLDRPRPGADAPPQCPARSRPEDGR